MRASLSSALVLCAVATLSPSCSPVCDGRGDACIELHIEGSGHFSNLEATVGYAIDVEPLQKRIALSGFGPSDPPLVRRIVRPAELERQRLRELSVRLIDRDSGLQSAGSVGLSLTADANQQVTVPLTFSFERHDVPTRAAAARVALANLDGVAPKELVVLLEQYVDPLSIYTLNPDGSGQEVVRRVIQPTSRWLWVGDLNHDGLDDLLITALLALNFQAGSMVKFTSDMTPLFGQSDGSLIKETPLFNVPSDPVRMTDVGWGHVVLADVNLDGQLDVISVSTVDDKAKCAPSLVTLHARLVITTLAPLAMGATTLTPQGTQAFQLCLPTAAHLAARDLNQDGYPEIIITHGGSATSYVNVLANDRGSFMDPGAQIGYEVLNEPNWVALNDFDGDGKIDIAVVAGQSSDLNILRNTTTGVGMPPLFVKQTPPAQLFGLARYGPAAVVSADFDQDGIADLATADGTEPTITILRGRGDGTFELPVLFAVGHSPVSLVADDLDGDGRVDLVIGHFSSLFVSLLYNRTPPR